MADSLTFPIRQGDLLPALTAVAFKLSGAVDFTAYTGGITFRMVKGSTVITGTATGDALGNLTYQWQSGDTAIAGTYAATFHGVDGGGRPQTFPTDRNLTVVIVPAI
ncbi:MAG TPA: hypothetical protein VFQ42_22260 [Mycobacterium sp.]|nr:hypothetical protein [Mycobacterium sp.]